MAVSTRSGFSAVTAFEAVNDMAKHPGVFLAQVPSIAHAAATATEYIASLIIPIDARIRAIYFIANAAVSGANTNTTHLNAQNGGVAGTGTTEIANIDLTSGNDLVSGAKSLMTESLTTAVSAGTVVRLQAEKVGTGLDVPAGTFCVLYDAGN